MKKFSGESIRGHVLPLVRQVSRWIRWGHSLLCRAVLIPVYLYRRFLSPLKGQGSCRFTPTCSQYCIDAVMEWGIVMGLGLAGWRVLRCNPFCRGGEDPVPRRRRKWGR